MGKESRKGIDVVALLEADNQRLARELLAATSRDEMERAIGKHTAYAERLDAESVRRHARRLGYESLSTNTRGGRPTRWFLHPGNAFSLGYATACVAVGLFHEDIGIAGAHKNTKTAEDLMDAAVKGRAMLSGLVIPTTGENAVREARLRGVVEQATITAIEEFAKLAPQGIPTTDVRVYTYGMTTAQPHMLPSYGHLVSEVIGTHPLLEGNTPPIDTSHLGKAVELVYGGQRHARFKTPTFVK